MSKIICNNNHNNNHHHHHHHHHHHKNEEELYVNIQSPDNRKRFTFFFEKNNEIKSTVLIIPDNLKFSALIGQIITKFQIDPSDRSKIRIKTDCGRRIKSLRFTYNNQIFYISISDLIDDEPEDANEPSSSSTTTTNIESNILKIEKFNYLNLFKDEKENTNLFYKYIIQPFIKKQISDVQLIVGESYPYRCKYIISNSLRKSRINLYFIEEPSNNVTELNYKFIVVFEATKYDSKISSLDFESKIQKMIQESNKDIFSIISFAVHYYNSNTTIKDGVSKVKTSTHVLFPDSKHAQTESQNYLLDSIYKDIQAVSKFNNIPNSLSKKLLFSNNFQTKYFVKGGQNSNHSTIVNTISPPHKSSNIRLYKFDALLKYQNAAQQSQEQNEKDEEECSICICDYPSSEMVELICSHKFCKNCLKHYFTSSIHDGNGNKIAICCPERFCENKCIDEVTIETLVQEPSTIKVNLKNLIKDYIYHVSGTFQCPEENCGRVLIGLRSTHQYAPYVHCSDHSFCVFCKKSGLHFPLPCANFKPQIKDDLYSYKWIMEFSCLCPKCSIPVERNQGCNHMTCRNCQTQFCYRCGGYWNSNHGLCTIEQRKSTALNVIQKKNTGITRKFLENFFNSNVFRSSDPTVQHLFESFLTMLSETNDSNNRKTLESLISSLRDFGQHSMSASQVTEFSSNIQKLLKKLLRPDTILKLYYGQGYFEQLKMKTNPVRSLSANICLNGSKKSLFKLFVNSNFNEFKQEISTQLNKKLGNPNAGNNDTLYDSKKLKIYNLYGGQIKSSIEILDGEPLFITKSINDKWVEPVIPALTEKEIEEALKLEKENQVDIVFNDTVKSFTILKQKDKRKNDKLKLLETELNQLKVQEQLKQLKQQLNNNNNNNNNNPTDDDNLYQYYYRSNIDNQEDQYYNNYDFIEDDHDLELAIENSTITNDCQKENNINNINNESLSNTSTSDDDEILFDFVNMDSYNSSSDFDSDIEKELDQELQSLQVEKEQKQIEMVMKILEIFKDDKVDLSFEKAFEICHASKNLSHACSIMTKYLDETIYQYQYKHTQQHLILKEILVDYYPNVSEEIIDRSLLCSNYNLDKAKSWIFKRYLKKEEKKQKKQLELLENSQLPSSSSSPPTTTITITKDTFIEDYEDDYDDYEEYEDYLNSNLHNRFSKKY